MECIICLTDISGSNYIQLECCKEKLHIECLHEWIKTNHKKNSDIKLCIYCKSNNNLINDIVNEINYNNQQHYCNEENTDIESNDNRENINEYNNFNNRTRNCIVLTGSLLLNLTIVLVILLL